MQKIDSRKLFIGITLITTGALVVGIGFAIGGSVGGAVLATLVA